MRCLLVLCAMVALASALGEEAYPTTAAKTEKEHPTNNYQYKYGISDGEKSLLLDLSLEGDSDDLNKAFFEYTNSRDQIYRTDYIADASHPEHVL